ncbi:MAG: hypothetical protein L0H15_10100 [Nitrosospira sp.]|nr:hypothetical protein [Nitrosospira sp.]
MGPSIRTLIFRRQSRTHSSHPTYKSFVIPAKVGRLRLPRRFSPYPIYKSFVIPAKAGIQTLTGTGRHPAVG